jgi:hypothetical protein
MSINSVVLRTLSSLWWLDSILPVESISMWTRSFSKDVFVYAAWMMLIYIELWLCIRIEIVSTQISMTVCLHTIILFFPFIATLSVFSLSLSLALGTIEKPTSFFAHHDSNRNSYSWILYHWFPCRFDHCKCFLILKKKFQSNVVRM